MNDELANLERHRPALLRWAECQMPVWLRGNLDPVDLVQQTFLEACLARERLLALSDLEVLAYMRRMLSNNLIDVARKFGHTRTDDSRDEFAESSARLADWLAADHSSPSERADRNERFERLALALAKLPDAQRIAVEMRYLQNLKVSEIASQTDRKENAVSQLLYRAVTALRGVLIAPDF